MKFSPATASCLLRQDPANVHDWTARMAVCEDACKKVFAKLTTEKNNANKASTTAAVAAPSGAATSKRGRKHKVKNVDKDVAESLGLDQDGSEVFDGLVEPAQEAATSSSLFMTI